MLGEREGVVLTDAFVPAKLVNAMADVLGAARYLVSLRQYVPRERSQRPASDWSAGGSGSPNTGASGGIRS